MALEAGVLIPEEIGLADPGRRPQRASRHAAALCFPDDALAGEPLAGTADDDVLAAVTGQVRSQAEPEFRTGRPIVYLLVVETHDVADTVHSVIMSNSPLTPLIPSAVETETIRHFGTANILTDGQSTV